MRLEKGHPPCSRPPLAHPLVSVIWSAGHVAHDVIALVAFRHEAKALSATEDDHSVVFDALENMFDNFVAIISSPFLQ